MAKTENLISDAVMAWLDEYPEATNQQIAKEVGCTTGYVWAIRKKMAYVPPCSDGHTPNAETEEALQEAEQLKSEPKTWTVQYAVEAVVVTDHADAAATMLETVVKQLRTGVSPEDLGPTVVLVGRMMARRT